MAKTKPPLALIAGPTASGKSALALAIAEAADGIVINADSAQVYRDLPILSAAPALEDEARAEHRLYGILDGDRPCSAADWSQLAKAEIARAHALGRMPVLAGGTGLYFRTLIDGIAPVPPIDPDIRKRVRSAPLERNCAELERLDPAAAARLKPTDTTRIARALEVVLSTGKTLQDWQATRTGGIAGEVDLRSLILLPPRDWLYARCDTRFTAMVEQGAIAEVERLLGHNLDPALPVMRAIGVREIAAYLLGQTDYGGMIAAGQQATRNYAKRQYTWFAHQPPAGWPRLTEQLEGTAIDRALALLGQKP